MVHSSLNFSWAADVCICEQTLTKHQGNLRGIADEKARQKKGTRRERKRRGIEEQNHREMAGLDLQLQTQRSME